VSDSWSAASGADFSVPGTEGCVRKIIEFLYNYHIQRFNNHKELIKKSINQWGIRPAYLIDVVQKRIVMPFDNGLVFNSGNWASLPRGRPWPEGISEVIFSRILRRMSQLSAQHQIFNYACHL
jgi:hypothetical protein